MCQKLGFLTLQVKKEIDPFVSVQYQALCCWNLRSRASDCLCSRVEVKDYTWGAWSFLVLVPLLLVFVFQFFPSFLCVSWESVREMFKFENPREDVENLGREGVQFAESELPDLPVQSGLLSSTPTQL